MGPFPPGFTGSLLDRMDAIREDGAALEAMRDRTDAQLLVLDGLDPVLSEQGGLCWQPLSEAAAHDERAFLGLLAGTPRFAALPRDATGHSARELWNKLTHLPAAEAALYAGARSLVDWHARHRFCARCGGATRGHRAGWARQCTGCGAQHFPRTDPVVIMVAEFEGKVLLGRQPAFPPKRYSALAGFVEVGESIEEAVARELAEEAGVAVHGIRYVASQPWPFPSSLMIACVAEARTSELRLDRRELEDAAWFTRDEVIASLDDDPEARFISPPPIAIAHTLLRAWVTR